MSKLTPRSPMMSPTAPQRVPAVARGADRRTNANGWATPSQQIVIGYRHCGWWINIAFRRHALGAQACYRSGVDGPHMIAADRRIGVQANAEGRGGAVTRRARAGIDQPTDKPGFPAVWRAVFHPPEEAVGCKVAIEPAAHFGGIAAEVGEEIEAFLQFAVGSDGAGKFPHLIEVLVVLDDQHSIAPLAVGKARRSRAWCSGCRAKELWRASSGLG